MYPSLTVLLPVFDAQSNIERLIGTILEVVPELTPRWEALLIDDGSRDATAEIIQDYVHGYPQLRLWNHPSRLGTIGCWHSGVGHSTGEWLLWVNETCRANLMDIGKLWQRASLGDVILGRVPGKATWSWIPRQAAQASEGEWQGPLPDLQLIRRQALRGWQVAGRDELPLSYLMRMGQPYELLEVRPAEVATNWRAHTAGRMGKPLPAKSRFVRPDNQPAKPNYLKQLRNFALGE